MELDFSSPNPTDEHFNEYWNMYLPSVKERPNLKQPHLYQLRILCEMCARRDYLMAWVDTHGETYESIGRNGNQWKTYPQVQMRDAIESKILPYMKILGLVLFKDTQTREPAKKNQFDSEEDDE